MNPIALFSLPLLVASLLPGDLSAADLAAGKASAEALCQICHGLDGQSTLVDAPHLSGQPEQYLVIQLEAYRSGQRQHPQMTIISRMLSDEDIANVALWYSSIRVTVEIPE